ncbi:MAG: hypothetical protein ACKOA9_07900 [Actinomycetota bacterium]
MAASVAAAVLALGGLGVAGALPGVDGGGESSSPRVKDAPDSDTSDEATESDTAEKDATVSEDATGLENAAGNVKNPVAAAVLGALLDPSLAGVNGPGKGEAVSDAARAANGSQTSDTSSGTTQGKGRP